MTEYTIEDIQKEYAEWENSKDSEGICDRAQYYTIKKIVELTNKNIELEERVNAVEHGRFKG